MVKVNLENTRCTRRGYMRRSYLEDEIDLVAVYCGGVDRSYLLPSTLVAGRRAIWLRLVPPRNSQRACINLASNYDFAGAVAQLEERVSGTHEATGSSPVSSMGPCRSETDPENARIERVPKPLRLYGSRPPLYGSVPCASVTSSVVFASM